MHFNNLVKQDRQALLFINAWGEYLIYFRIRPVGISLNASFPPHLLGKRDDDPHYQADLFPFPFFFFCFSLCSAFLHCFSISNKAVVFRWVYRWFMWNLFGRCYSWLGYTPVLVIRPIQTQSLLSIWALPTRSNIQNHSAKNEAKKTSGRQYVSRFTCRTKTLSFLTLVSPPLLTQ